MPPQSHQKTILKAREGAIKSYVPVSLFDFILSSLRLYAKRIVELGFFYHRVVVECVNALSREMWFVRGCTPKRSNGLMGYKWSSRGRPRKS